MNFSSTQPRIVVVGSCSLDLVLYTQRLPCSNGTVLATHSESYFGGKGANQAVGAARLGANVYFVGCVGMDPLGQQIMRNLVSEEVNVTYVSETENDSTGTAYVTSSTGNASIVVVPAANNHLTPKNIEEADKCISSADLILLQLEIPIDVIEYTVRKAKKYGKMVGIYASPGRRLSEEIIDGADFIVVKSTELEVVFGENQKEIILTKYFNKVFIRDDTNSTIYFDGTEMKYFRYENDNMVFRMGMGDAFTSGFAIALCHGNTIEDCVKFGNEVSSRVSLGTGAQTRLPRLADFV